MLRLPEWRLKLPLKSALFWMYEAECSLRAGVHVPTKSVVLIFHVIFMATQYTRPTGQSYQNDHRHVGVMPATPAISPPGWCAEQVRTPLPCDLTFCSTNSDFVGACMHQTWVVLVPTTISAHRHGFCRCVYARPSFAFGRRG